MDEEGKMDDDRNWTEKRKTESEPITEEERKVKNEMKREHGIKLKGKEDGKRHSYSSTN